MTWALALVALALAACAPAAPPGDAAEAPHGITVRDDRGRCFEIERTPSPQGGLSIPRQIVCPLVSPPKRPAP